MTKPTLVELYQREYGPMVRVAWLILGSQAAAEDIVQDAFERVGRRYDTVATPAAYLRVAVVNACRNDLRRARRIIATPPPDAVVEQPELNEMYAGLRVLTSRHRAAIVLRYVDDRSDAEIATILHVRQATVRSMIHRGLTQLRKGNHDIR